MYKKGYVEPSGLLSIIDQKTVSAFNKKYQNTPLRMGCIVEVYEIDNPNNTSGGVIVQYDVVTDEQGAHGTNFVLYPNCIALDGIGGIGDFFEYKLRNSSDEPFSKTYDFKKQNGTLVIMLCLDGFAEKGVVIGGVKHPTRKTTLTKEAGLHLEGEYNGLNWKIDKDGALTVTFKSKTNNEGIPQDKQAGGTHIQIDKTGQVDINTGLKDAEETYIRMDKKNKDVGLKAGNNIGLTAKKDVGINAEGNVNISSKASVAINAEGTANFTAKSAITVDGGSALTLKGGNVTLNGENGVTIEGQKTSINTSKIYLGQGGTPALLQTTQFIGVGNFGAPVVSQAIGPFSSTVFIAP